jgi:CRP-like cAMP-binding protein
VNVTSGFGDDVAKVVANPMPDPASIGQQAAVPVVSVHPGDFVFRAGDAADALFIISTGHIELLPRGEKSGRLALLAPGDLCGEDGVFEGQVRAYDARAVNAATLLRVSADLFLDLVRARPELAGAMINATAARLLRARAAAVALARPSESQAAGAARLVHVESGAQFALPARATIIVGRADPKFTPDIELSSLDLQRSLSRRHAVITRAATGAQLTEQPRVANGTFVNGVRLTQGVAVSITDGDEVAFGLITTVFRTT